MTKSPISVSCWIKWSRGAELCDARIAVWTVWIVVLSVLGLVVSWVIGRLERFFLRWR
jgi:ABC-type nitrate/sulfonate/bicarbonate transport system permease component